MARSVSGRGLIALTPVDAKVRARGLCRYSAADGLVKADISASQLSGAHDYIAIIIIEGRLELLGALESGPGGWRLSGEARGKTADAALVCIRDGYGARIVLAGKRMGAQLELKDAMERVRLSFMGQAAKAKAAQTPPAKAPESPANTAQPPEAMPEATPEAAPVAQPPKAPPEVPPEATPEMPEPRETAQAQVIEETPEPPPVLQETPAQQASARVPEKLGEIRPPALLDRFVMGGEGRSITDMSAAKAVSGEDDSAGYAFLDAPCIPPEDDDMTAQRPPKGRRMPDPNALLRSARPSYVRSVSSPFPGQYKGASWVVTRYPGAAHPHYLAARWRRGKSELFISAVPGEYAPSPPPWLSGFSRHLASRWGQGYWLCVSDYSSGKTVD